MRSAYYYFIGLIHGFLLGAILQAIYNFVVIKGAA